MDRKIQTENIYRIDHLPGEDIEFSEEDGYLQSHREYDRSGNLLLEIAYTFDGDIADKVENRYDESGRLRESLVFGEDGDILERKEIIRNDERVSKELIHYLDGSMDIHEHFYDEKGNLTGIRVYDDEDELESEEKYSYKNDQIVKIEKSDEEGNLIFRLEDEYVDGVLKTRTIWSNEEEEPFTLLRHFNSAGRLELEERYNEQRQLIECNVTEENDKGQIIKMVEENRQRKNTTLFSYDERGNVIHQVEKDLNDELNHEVFRLYGDSNELLQTTVEYIMKASHQKQAYTLFVRREYF